MRSRRGGEPDFVVRRRTEFKNLATSALEALARYSLNANAAAGAFVPGKRAGLSRSTDDVTRFGRTQMRMSKGYRLRKRTRATWNWCTRLWSGFRRLSSRVRVGQWERKAKYRAAQAILRPDRASVAFNNRACDW